jgi:hypothetical protein
VAGAGNGFLASSLGAGGGSSTSTQISMAMPTGNVNGKKAKADPFLGNRGPLVADIATLSQPPEANVGIVQASPYSSPMLATEGVAEGGAAAPLVAKSIKCVETGRIFEDMVDAQVCAERTGRSDFEESTEEVKVGCEQRAHCVCVCVYVCVCVCESVV